jgi:hypothetical protein
LQLAPTPTIDRHRRWREHRHVDLALSGSSAVMKKSPRIIPFRVLVRLVPRAWALLWKVIEARGAARDKAPEREAPRPARFQPPVTPVRKERAVEAELGKAGRGVSDADAPVARAL